MSFKAEPRRPDPSRDPKDDTIRVGVRCRPMRPDLSGKPGLGYHEGQSRVAMVNFDHTFSFVLGPKRSQGDVYAEIAHSLVMDTLKGFNTSIIAYGITGSGKTYTMFGTETSPGIVVRAARQLFESIASGEFGGHRPQVSVSFLEIYQKKVLDLLRPESEALRVVGAEGNRTMPALTELGCPTVEHLLEIIRAGQESQHFRTTAANDISSRSHSILTLHVETGGRKSKLVLVDLAGAENLKNNGLFEAPEQKSDNPDNSETASINSSLSVLTSVVHALNSGARHIPYRESPLTRLLQDSLGGGSRTCILVTVGPEEELAAQTIQTLRIAERMHAVVNKVLSPPPLPEKGFSTKMNGRRARWALPPVEQPPPHNPESEDNYSEELTGSVEVVGQSGETVESGSPMLKQSTTGGGCSPVVAMTPQDIISVVREAVRDEFARERVSKEEISKLRSQVMMLAEQNTSLAKQVGDLHPKQVTAQHESRSFGTSPVLTPAFRKPNLELPTLQLSTPVLPKASMLSPNNSMTSSTRGLLGMLHVATVEKDELTIEACLRKFSILGVGEDGDQVITAVGHAAEAAGETNRAISIYAEKIRNNFKPISQMVTPLSSPALSASKRTPSSSQKPPWVATNKKTRN